MASGQGKSAGSAARICCSTCGAPVDPTIPSTATGRAMPIAVAAPADAAARGRGGIAGRLPTRALAARRRAAARLATVPASSPWVGLANTSAAPYSSACQASRWSVWAAANTTMGVGHSAITRRMLSGPPMIGISTSMVTTSGRSCLISRSAARPSPASPTTCMPGICDRASRSRLRTSEESSTISTRTVIAYPRNLAIIVHSPACEKSLFTR